MLKERHYNKSEYLLMGKAVNEKLDKWGVKSIAFDFDDTIVDTRKLFGSAILDVCTMLCQSSSVSDVLKLHKQIMAELRPSLGINPAIMILTTDILAKMQGVSVGSALYKQAMERTEAIYTTDKVEIFEGAIETIEIANATGKPTILFTHADSSWTYRKKLDTGMIGKFSDTVCIRVEEVKKDQWEPRLAAKGISLSNILVVGDNLHADILPVVSKGGRGVWINQMATLPTPSSGIEVSKETLQEKVIEIHTISEVIPAILAA